MAKTKISIFFFLFIIALDLVVLMPFEATATRPISATTISTSSSPESDPHKPYSSPMLIPAALAPSPTMKLDVDVHQSSSSTSTSTSHLNGDLDHDDVHQSSSSTTTSTSHLNGDLDHDDDCHVSISGKLDMNDGHESEEECIMRKTSMFEHTDYIYTQDFNDHHQQQHP